MITLSVDAHSVHEHPRHTWLEQIAAANWTPIVTSVKSKGAIYIASNGGLR